MCKAQPISRARSRPHSLTHSLTRPACCQPASVTPLPNNWRGHLRWPMTSLVVHFCSAPLVCFVDALDMRRPVPPATKVDCPRGAVRQLGFQVAPRPPPKRCLDQHRAVGLDAAAVRQSDRDHPCHPTEGLWGHPISADWSRTSYAQSSAACSNCPMPPTEPGPGIQVHRVPPLGVAKQRPAARRQDIAGLALAAL